MWSDFSKISGAIAPVDDLVFTKFVNEEYDRWLILHRILLDELLFFRAKK
ncbi:hypothetical protein [Chroococcidiopsis sp. CCNUC1]|nr:hypothetical protein [Chroococcidiopsis sp. CCNUC1]URD52859.1 hypothetical protein M5J74_12855 [Chroococcidiopsis sp. CCNUC1]